MVISPKTKSRSFSEPQFCCMVNIILMSTCVCTHFQHVQWNKWRWVNVTSEHDYKIQTSFMVYSLLCKRIFFWSYSFLHINPLIWNLVQNYMMLLAYEEPEMSPVFELLSINHRQNVADSLNQSILGETRSINNAIIFK